MRSVSILLIASCLVLLSHSEEHSKCESLHQLLAFASCAPLVNEMKDYMAHHQGQQTNPEVVKNMTNLCERTSNCLGAIQCKESTDLKNVLDKSCEMLHYIEEQNLKCLKGFFTAAYLAKTSNSSSCFQEYDFLEKDLPKRQAAYSRGESCFLDYIRRSCTESSVDYFTKNYNKLADGMSIKPPGEECKNVHNQLNAIQCTAIGTEAGNQISQLSGGKIQPNDPRVAKAIKLCRDTQSCMSESCLVHSSIRQKLVQSCDLLEMTQSSFAVCLSGIMNDKPDLSKFKCLGDMDFFDRDRAVSCQKYTSKKECVKEVMIDICGEESVVDFDTIAEKVTKQFEC